MRILVDGTVYNHYPHGGVARVFTQLMPRVCELDAEIHFEVICNSGAVGKLPKHANITSHVFESKNWRPSRIFSRLNTWRRKQFDASIHDLNPQIFHSTYYTSPPFLGMKVVATVYDLIDHEFPFFSPNGPGFAARQCAVLKSADQIMSISHATAQAAATAFGIGTEKFATAHLDASAVFFPASADETQQFKARHTDHLPFFLFVGVTGHYKNLATLLRGFAASPVSMSHVLLIAGHSLANLDSWCYDLAVTLGIERKIIKLWHPTDDVLRVAYGAATAFVFPSLQEGFGIPLIEAMRCQTPIIASDIPVFREICGHAAMYFDPHSPSELGVCLSSLLNGSAAAALVNAGTARAKEFSWDKTARKLLEIYRTALK